jgi:hypothetical protein
MLRAIISDIHSNVEALDAVLADVARRKVESIVCLGDVIGYGPQPRETLQRSTEWEITLLGNHEEACMFHPEDFNERARIALEWTRDQLNSKSAAPDENFKLWSLIGAMPTQHKIENALLVHGSPRDPVREYMLPRDAQDEVWGEDPARAVPAAKALYHAYFRDHVDISDPDNAASVMARGWATSCGSPICFWTVARLLMADPTPESHARLRDHRSTGGQYLTPAR